MTATDYRIESANPMEGPLLPVSGATQYFVSTVGMAVVMAVKTATIPFGSEIRVVYVPTGEIVFRLAAATATSFSDE